MASDKLGVLTIPKYNIWGEKWPYTSFAGILEEKLHENDFICV